MNGIYYFIWLLFIFLEWVLGHSWQCSGLIPCSVLPMGLKEHNELLGMKAKSVACKSSPLFLFCFSYLSLSILVIFSVRIKLNKQFLKDYFVILEMENMLQFWKWY